MHTALFCSKLKKIVLLSVSAALCFAGGGLDAAPGKKGTAKMQKVQKVQKVDIAKVGSRHPRLLSHRKQPE